jgi:ABC-2 type transport system ATP-binding protein
MDITTAPFPLNWDSLSGRGTVAITDIEQQLPVFLNFLKSRNLHIKDMECRRKTLDDLFTEMTGRRLHE